MYCRLRQNIMNVLARIVYMCMNLASSMWRILVERYIHINETYNIGRRVILYMNMLLRIIC